MEHGRLVSVRPALARALKLGCLLTALTLCGTFAAIVAALQSGPVQLGLPGDTLLRLGSDDFVLSNYSFHSGTTYYLDWDGNGLRNIVQLHYLEDAHAIEVVLHHATRNSSTDLNLLKLTLP